MAVQVPRLQQVQPAQEAKNDRIKFNVKDNVSGILNRTNQIAGVVSEADKLHTAFEDETINTALSEDNIEYNTWKTAELKKYKKMGGDPATNYAQFDVEEKKYLETMREKRGELSSRAQRHIDTGLGKIVLKGRDQVLRQRTAHQQVYDKDLYNANVDISKRKMPESGSKVSFLANGDVDISSYDGIRGDMSDIKTLISKRGIKQDGSVTILSNKTGADHSYKDGDGKDVYVKFDNRAKNVVAKEMSEGIAASVNALLVNQPEKGKALFNDFKGHIDPVERSKIQKKINVGIVKQDADAYITKHGVNVSLSKINKLEFGLRQEVKSKITSFKNNIEADRKRRAKYNYEILAKQVIAKQRSEKPYGGMSDLEETQNYKERWDLLDSKQRTNIIEEINAPQESNSDSVLKLQNLFLGLDPDFQLDTISPEDFQEHFKSGLNKAKKAEADRIFNRMRVPTAGKERSFYSGAYKQLEERLIIDNHISQKEFGQHTRRDMKKLRKAKDALMGHLESAPGYFSESRTTDFVKVFSASIIDEEAFIPPEPKGIQKTSSTPFDVSKYNDNQWKKGRDLWNDAYPTKRWPNQNDPNFQKFMQNNSNNLGN